MAAQAQSQIDSREGIALENQILELKQELSQLQQLQVQAQGPQSSLPPPSPEGGGQVMAPPNGGGASSDITAQLLVRVSALEDQLRTMHGRIEELASAQQRDHDELTKEIGDLAFKLNPASASAPGAPPTDAAGAPPPATGPAAGMDLSTQAPPPPPPAAPTHVTAEVALKQGNAALARRDYPGAEAAARTVLAMPHGPHAADAQYLLARALNGEHQYKASAASFFAVYKASPRAPRGAEGLLGVANAMLGLNDTRDACEALAKFNAEFPHADSVLRQAAASIHKRGHCG
jgi:TolA-binding protein